MTTELEKWFDAVTFEIATFDPQAFATVDLIEARRQIGAASELVTQPEQKPFSARDTGVAGNRTRAKQRGT